MVDLGREKGGTERCPVRKLERVKGGFGKRGKGKKEKKRGCERCKRGRRVGRRKD